MNTTQNTPLTYSEIQAAKSPETRAAEETAAKDRRREQARAATAANRAAIAAALVRGPVTEQVTDEAATDAQVNYLVALLPRYYQQQKDDGITVLTALFSATGELNMAAIRALTKRDASGWISAAKAEIA
jgi:hypothetical protein